MGKSYKVINEEKGIGISYIPKKPNGVAIIMREPGDVNHNVEEHIKGNCDWFKQITEEMPETKDLSLYRNRYREMLWSVGISRTDKKPNELSNVYYANILYGEGGSSRSDKYNKLGNAPEGEKIEDRIEMIIKSIKENGVDLKKVFVIKDGFDALTKKEKGLSGDGIEYKIKYKKFSKDGIDYYAVRHPVGSPHISYEK